MATVSCSHDNVKRKRVAGWQCCTCNEIFEPRSVTHPSVCEEHGPCEVQTISCQECLKLTQEVAHKFLNKQARALELYTAALKVTDPGLHKAVLGFVKLAG